MKRDKVFFWRSALSLMVVALTFAISSCTKELLGTSTLSDDEMEVRVTFPRSVVTRSTTGGTEVGTDDENRLERVTILIFNGDGSKLETVLSEDVRSSNTALAASQPKWESEQTLLVGPLIDPFYSKVIYAVANWNKTTFDESTYTDAMLKAELTTINAVADINGTAAYPMLMSGSKSIPSITSESYSISVDMERQASKIKTLFTIPTNVQDAMPQIEWQTELMKITVANVPNKSYVVGCGASPAGVTLLNSASIAVDNTKPLASDQTVPATNDLKWGESVYITENPVVGALQANKDASTYIVVQLPYKNRITGTIDYDNYYKLHVNDTRDADSPHKVLRNTIYNFNIRILGMGLPINDLVPDVNIDDQLTVNSWEKGEMGEMEFAQGFFNIDRTRVEFQLHNGPIEVSIATNVPDWKLLKEDGQVLLSSIEGAKTVTVGTVTYTLSINNSSVILHISRSSNLSNFPMQKMLFVIKNFQLPFSVAYENGLIQPELYDNAAWPSDKLPRSSLLQLAKRGDKIQVNGEQGLNDPLKEWKTSNTSTPGTGAGLAMGANGTAAMAGVEHPAAQYCRDMGGGWFLPSLDELGMIYDLFADPSHDFGVSYLFSDESYWSSTEDDSGNSWVVNFSKGGITKSVASKTSKHRVRCMFGSIPLNGSPEITVAPTELRDIPNVGGKYTVRVTSNYHWTAYSPQVNGVTFNPSSGEAGTDIPVEITFTKNVTLSSQDITLLFSTTVGDVTKNLKFIGYQDTPEPPPANSYIPSSVLAAAGWPLDGLPAVGLQLAMRGIRVYPGNRINSLNIKDAFRVWKRTNTSTVGTAHGLGTGFKNTAAMAGDEHPAAQYCRDMGSEWYLPSKDELHLIIRNRNIFSSFEYNFDQSYTYWSSTERDSKSSWRFFIDDVSESTASEKSYSYGIMVRCVRNL